MANVEVEKLRVLQRDEAVTHLDSLLQLGVKAAFA